MESVKIGSKDMALDFGCILAHKEIGFPLAQTKMVEVPLRDGALDLTEVLTGEVKYNNRKIKLKFLYLGNNLTAEIENLQNYMHGKKMQIIFSDDSAYFYLGRVELDEWNTKKGAGILALEVDAEPYKYDVNSSAVDWEWDCFDFEDGVINEAGNLNVNGSLTFNLYCRGKRMFPEFTTSAPMTMTYKGETYNLKAGTQKVYGLFLEEGNNNLTFTGNGTLSIDYRGGIL